MHPKDQHLPLPVVLIIGDFQIELSHGFGKLAWDRILQTYQKYAPTKELMKMLQEQNLEVVHKVTAMEMLNRFRKKINLRNDDVEYYSPIPVPLSHGNLNKTSRTLFRKHLYQYLVTFDVCAIIACGPGNYTQFLFKSLEALRIPTITTVDSTVKHSRQDQHHVRHLMPNNDTQAQAILTRLVALLENHGEQPVTMFSHPRDDVYVTDLRNALMRQFKAFKIDSDPQDKSIANDVIASEDEGIVICIGYKDALKQLIQTERTGRYLIMSDGCFRSDALDEITSNRRSTLHHHSTQYYGTRPSVQPGLYAEDAFAAIRTVWMEERESLLPEKRLISFEMKIERVLQESHENTYLFQGYYNKRAAYIVEHLDRRTREAWRSILK